MKAQWFIFIFLLFSSPWALFGQHSENSRKRSVLITPSDQSGGGWQSKYGFNFNEVPRFPDIVYETRIANLNSDIPLRYNSYVRPFIEHYSLKRREITERALDLSRLYFPVFDEMLEEAGLPLWLKYLAVAESTLDPVIESHAEAVGLWQFIAGTGQMYGLKENYFIDDRRNPIKSTRAAIEHLKDLYDVYEDWFLVFAAYNSGAGNVNKAIRRANGNKDYWAIRKYLPQETRGYVPSFIAACYVLNYHEEHNLYPFTNVDLPQQIDSVNAIGPISFEKLCSGLEMNLELMELLNPQFKRSAIPDDGKVYKLCVPADMVQSFVENGSGFRITYPTIQNMEEVLNPAETDSSSQEIKDEDKSSEMRYVVRTGDSVYKLSAVFGCSESELRAWNAMSNNSLRVGTELVFKVIADERKRVEERLKAHTSQ